jgi:hypothetical protein
MDRLVAATVVDSPAVRIMSDLHRAGFHVALRADGVLSIAPRSRLSPERMHMILRCKDEMKRVLRACDEQVLARRDAFAEQLARTPAPSVPAFLFKTGIPYVKGTCFSCGDRLEECAFGRCWRCSLAWRLVCRAPVPSELADAWDDARVSA